MNQDIVHIDCSRAMEEVEERSVNVTLECGRRIAQPIVHNEEIKRTIPRPEGGFPFIAFCNPDEVISTSEVEFCETLGHPEMIQEVWDEREGVLILPSNFVQSSVVNAESEQAIFFLYEENSSSGGRFRLMDKSFGQIVLQKLPEC